MPPKNRAIKVRSLHQSNSSTKSEPEVGLRESETSTQSQSNSYEEDLGPEAQLRESQIILQACPDTDVMGPEPEVGSPTALIEEPQELLENQEETLSTYVSPQEAGSSTEEDDVEVEVEVEVGNAQDSSDEDRQNFGQRQGETLGADINRSKSGSQMELEDEDGPVHMASNEVSHDPSQYPSKTQAVQSQESDPDDLDRGGEPPLFFRNGVFRKTSQGSTHHVVNPNISPPARFDTGPALQNLYSDTEDRPESTESTPPSLASQYPKFTEMVRTETTRIMRSSRRERVRIEVLKRDPETRTLREKEEDLEDHETVLIDLIGELTSDLKKTRNELKRAGRMYRRSLADFQQGPE